jgi:hypothetical protein
MNESYVRLCRRHKNTQAITHGTINGISYRVGNEKTTFLFEQPTEMLKCCKPEALRKTRSDYKPPRTVPTQEYQRIKKISYPITVLPLPPQYFLA